MMKAGIVGFLPEDGSDVWERFELCAKMGYAAMDMDLTYAAPGGDLRDNYRRIREIGIRPIMCGVSPEVLENPGPKIEAIHIQEIDQVCMYSSCLIGSFQKGYGYAPDFDEVRRDFDFMNRAIDLFEREGLHFCYHNHFQEFVTCYEGVSAFDRLLLSVDPRLRFNVDVGWAMVGGQDPVALLRRLEGRVGNVHLKDFYDLEKPRHINQDPASRVGFTSLGSGLLDVDAVLAEMDRQGVPYACVEQDVMRNLSDVETLRASYLRMKESGFVR